VGGGVPGHVKPLAEPRQGTRAPFDIAVGLPVGVDLAPYAKAGATWWMPEVQPEASSADRVRGVLCDGPAIGAA
jgi:hypothetical protein